MITASDASHRARWACSLGVVRVGLGAEKPREIRPEDGLATVATTEQPASTEHPSPVGDFGANEWLVEDMYERYQADPDSVDAAWHDFFKDYRPGPGAGNGRSAEPAAQDKP